MNWEAWKPLATLAFTTALKFAGGLLVAHGLATNGPGLEALGGAATTAAGSLWSWWVQKGHIAAGDWLKHLTDTATQAAAIEVAKRMSPASSTGAAASAKAEVKAIEPAVMAKDAATTAVKVLLIAFALSAFLAIPSAQAQIKFKPLPDPLKLNQAAAQAKAVITGQPAPDPAATLSCDFKMLTKLTPDNLIPTMKACLSDVNSQLVNDTQRALDSAKVYGGTGDGDGVNCLTPGLAIFKAGVQVPAVPAVIAADGTVTTPAVPAQDPGPILLYQKYREFTLSGALTSCQSWFNGPINATAAAGLAGAGTAIAGAALLAPK